MAKTRVDIAKGIAKLDLTSSVAQQEATVLLEQAAQIGVDVAQRKLVLSTTKWGTKRFNSGRGASAGRDDSGSMIDNLRADKVDVSSGKLEVKFGWGRGRTKNYYKYQEYGSKKIKAALSLFEGRTAVLNELPRLELNMKARIKRKVK